MKPLVSVCIPTYNGAKYLKECLDSVLAQTFTDFEVLIVDDKSSDETLSIAQEYATYDPRFRVIQNECNLGLVGNWNRCVELAQGEWIKFIFQDDLIEPACLERMLAVRKSESAITAAVAILYLKLIQPKTLGNPI
jgi:glycosyltransferase involved in cell wall biosynthesis